MKIFISSDMEGTAGVVDWEQVRPGSPAYASFTELLTAEVNAAITGARAAGATEFLVNDSHGRMANLRPDALAGRASYLSGRFKPRYMMEGLDASFDGVFMVSYHGSMLADGSVLSHTYFPGAIAEVCLNGVVVGEAGVNALVAKHYGVPVLLVTGDDTTAREAASVCPGVRTAVVKRSVTRFAAESLHPAAACELIEEQARLAVAGVAGAPLPAIELPAELRVRFHTSDYADLASRVAGVRRTGTVSASITGEDALEVFTTFITVVLLCRGLVE